MTDQPAVTQSPVPQKFKLAGQHYSSPLQAVHGPAVAAPPAVSYECKDCQDLYERLRKVLKDMGHEF